LVENWVLCFLQIRWFSCNDPNHEFEKLKQVNIFSFLLMIGKSHSLFNFHHSTLVFFLKKKISFVIFFILFFIVLSWSHNLTRVDSGLVFFFFVFFLPNFFLLYLMGWELSYIVYSFLKKIFFSEVIMIIFKKKIRSSVVVAYFFLI
jgi:hypothetical protein